MESNLSKSDSKYPYADTEIARLIRERIDALAGTKMQREIAAEIGYEKANVLSMYKRGEAKVPLRRLPDMARALDLDLGLLFRAWLAQEWPGEERAIAQMVSERVVTQNDRAVIKLVRDYLRAGDPEVSIDLLKRLRRAFED